MMRGSRKVKRKRWLRFTMKGDCPNDQAFPHLCWSNNLIRPPVSDKRKYEHLFNLLLKEKKRRRTFTVYSILCIVDLLITERNSASAADTSCNTWPLNLNCSTRQHYPCWSLSGRP